MRWLLALALIGCGSKKDSQAAPEPQAAPKPPDEMDEKMRHCPLALDGAVSTLDDIEAGVRFTIKAPAPSVEEARRRAHHIVDFAARKTRDGHGGFDGKGGGRMKNCPIVTDDVTITAADLDGGAQLDVVTSPERVDALRLQTKERVEKFPFAGATITLGATLLVDGAITLMRQHRDIICACNSRESSDKAFAEYEVRAKQNLERLDRVGAKANDEQSREMKAVAKGIGACVLRWRTP